MGVGGKDCTTESAASSVLQEVAYKIADGPELKPNTPVQKGKLRMVAYSTVSQCLPEHQKIFTSGFTQFC